jgi:hypothetical protein
MKLLVIALLLILAAAPAGRQSGPPASAVPEEDLEEFIPSERLPADSAISFPVDI